MLRAVVALFVLGCGGGPTPAPATPASPDQPAPAAGTNKQELAKLQVKRLAFEAFPTWASNNPDKECPADIAELAAASSPDDAKDPWGTEVKMFCGKDTLPAGAVGLAVVSAGEDQKFDTADDVRSWD